MSLSENLLTVRKRIECAVDRSGVPRPVKIVAVTKTHPPATIIEAHHCGLTTIGENRIQEAAMKFPALPDLAGFTKRMIGHLQSNKVNKAIDLFDTIDTVDSVRLAKKIGQRAQLLGKEIPVLLEVNTSGETTKFGFDPQNIEPLLTCMEIDGITINGLMTLGPLTEDKDAIRQAFIQLRSLKESLNVQRPNDHPQLLELSMGMSGDFEVAIEEGSTMVRLGTTLFGPRRSYS